MDISLIHKENPYKGFDYKKYPLDLQGWGSTDPNFKKYIDKVNPRLIIEVGSWKGGSAIFMGNYIKEKGLDCKIICVDTWLGAVEFLTNQNDPERYLALNKQNGYPSVYYQFLANVMHMGLQDIIIPFPQTATLAARFMLLNNIKADMIYIDASHDEKDVYDDINNYWQLLNTGGVIFGDDYDEHWPGVKLAVNNFVADNDMNIDFSIRQWVIEKTKDNVDKSSYNIHQRARDNKKLAIEYESELFKYKQSVIDKAYDVRMLDERLVRIVAEADKKASEAQAQIKNLERIVEEKSYTISKLEDRCRIAEDVVNNKCDVISELENKLKEAGDISAMKGTTLAKLENKLKEAEEVSAMKDSVLAERLQDIEILSKELNDEKERLSSLIVSHEVCVSALLVKEKKKNFLRNLITNNFIIKWLKGKKE